VWLGDGSVLREEIRKIAHKKFGVNRRNFGFMDAKPSKEIEKSPPILPARSSKVKPFLTTVGDIDFIGKSAIVLEGVLR